MLTSKVAAIAASISQWFWFHVFLCNINQVWSEENKLTLANCRWSSCTAWPSSTAETSEACETSIPKHCHYCVMS